MVNIRRTKSTVLTAGATLAGLLALVWVAIAFWAMWTMLGAAFDSDWLQAALMLMLWTTAVGTAYLCLAPPHGRLSRLGQDQRQPVNFDLWRRFAGGANRDRLQKGAKHPCCCDQGRQGVPPSLVWREYESSNIDQL
jgi:hypothetical protein